MEEHIIFDERAMALRLLDQRLLPARREYHVCRSCIGVRDAIRDMVVRGAPAIGVCAAFGCVLAARGVAGVADWRARLRRELDDLAAARPTAINLAWAVNRMLPDVNNPELSLEAIEKLWLEKALAMREADIRICHEIGAAGADLIHNGDSVLTHCNAGALATAGYGTALGVIRAAVAQGKKISVIADETRPFFQGSRLTAWELAEDGIAVKIACDNACALLMSKGMVQIVIVGADRVAANGDTANKIGTYGVALLASHFKIPFYVACPLSTIDASLPDGSRIPIEERASSEATRLGGMTLAPDNVEAFNFAFDVTPAGLISGIITEAGILRAPYTAAIAAALAKK